MRDALLITFILIFIFVSIGAIYNLMEPYLLKMGFKDGGIKITNDGGVFLSFDFARSWEQVIEAEGGGRYFKKQCF